jgi:hypothetical protein
LYLATAFATEGLTTTGSEVALRFEKAFQSKLNLDAAQGYDSARFLFDGLRRTQVPGGLAFSKALANIDTFETLTGTLTIQGGSVRRPGFLIEMKGGAARVVGTIAAPES